MKKDWYDKYGKEFHCADCTFLDSCLKKDEPLYSRCCEQYLRDRIAELEEQLKNARKETAKKVIDRVEELSVFDFKACEAIYMITEPELDCILREFQGEIND